MTNDDGERRMDAFTDAELAKELARRGRLETFTTECWMSPEAAAIGQDCAVHAERRMATDLGLHMAERGGVVIVRSAEHTRMTATVLVARPTPSENTDGR